MGRYLMLDIGAGTLDMLYYETGHDLYYKAVVRSPVRELADEIRRTSGNLLVTGSEMGGGPVSQALTERAATATVVMTERSAATIHHDRQRVIAHGIDVVSEAEADGLKKDPRFHHLRSADVQPDRLGRLVRSFGVPYQFDVVAVCAQDHGAPPPGVSHLDFRNRMFAAALDQNPAPQALLYRSDQVPREMTRLAVIAKDAAALPADRVYVMDSGMAAILGGAMDMLAAGKERLLLLDVATSHTVGAAMEAGTLCGFFEYHTRELTVARLDRLVKELCDGTIAHRRVVAEGGHGAYIRQAYGYAGVQLILATGPRRRLVAGSTLPLTFGAPWGDNMMTGTVGLLEALRLREGLPPIHYI